MPFCCKEVTMTSFDPNISFHIQTLSTFWVIYLLHSRCWKALRPKHVTSHHIVKLTVFCMFSITAVKNHVDKGGGWRLRIHLSSMKQPAFNCSWSFRANLLVMFFTGRAVTEHTQIIDHAGPVTAVGAGTASCDGLWCDSGPATPRKNVQSVFSITYAGFDWSSVPRSPRRVLENAILAATAKKQTKKKNTASSSDTVIWLQGGSAY